ncbi:RNA polymerase sigma factor [Sphingomonas jaspsi]|uniref:RNA polymerase sigma factor n=1 Tax=Sphingomonas jaspsi TaxID=392409 RepID=UPI0004B7FD1C|nr:sigma-70 family RNA polymerase sigma factor [Sphingomonas jaspsi]
MTLAWPRQYQAVRQRDRTIVPIVSPEWSGWEKADFVNSPGGLLTVLEANRARLVRYFAAHGAGEEAEDLIQELAIRLEAANRPVASPLSYIYRTATNLMIDWRRARQQSLKRDAAWADANDRFAEAVDHQVRPDQAIDARQRVDDLAAELANLGERARRILIGHRVEGKSQRELAAELGVSISTVESDLRQAYRLLSDLRVRWNKGDAS